MSLMNRYLLLNIAGFYIKTSFHQAKNASIKSALFWEIKKSLKGFVISKNTSKIDFSIDIKHVSRHNTLKAKDQLNYTYYLPYFHIKNNKRLVTYYYINHHIFQHILDFILKKLLNESPGFILHASSVATNGKADIFLAPSGGGKSTIIKLMSDKYRKIGDDNIFIRKYNNEFFVFQTPFEEKNRLNKNNSGYKLNDVYFLKKSEIFKVSKIKNKDQIYKKLLSSIIADKNDIQKIIPAVILFLKKFDNFYKLGFRKNKKEIREFFSLKKI